MMKPSGGVTKKRQAALSWAAVGGPSAGAPTQPARKGRAPPPRPGPAGRLDLGAGSIVVYAPRAVPASGDLLAALLAEVEWLQKDVTVFGRTTPQRRLVAFLNAPGRCVPPYTYSRLTLHPAPWPAPVAAAADAVIAAAVAAGLPPPRFNCVLANLYRDGADCMAWHADAEGAAYGPRGSDIVIGSASFGTARDFVLRRNADHGDRVTYSLACGDVLIMAGATQAHWQHAVPARAAAGGPRVNLTFRWHKEG